MTSVTDDKGYNQGFALHHSTVVRMQRRADWLLSSLQLTKNATILEVGCGTGEVAYWMAQKTEATVIGIDTCAPFIEYAQKNYSLPNLQFKTLSVQELQRSDLKHVDAIVGNGILHHLEPDLKDMLRLFHDLLAPGGQLTFMEPNYYNPYVFAIFSNKHLRRLAKLEPNEMAFSKTYIDHLLQETGFNTISVTYRDFLIPGVPNFLIKPLVIMGGFLEKIPFVRAWAQSLFITATK